MEQKNNTDRARDMQEILKTVKILYVEDEAEAREELTDVLKRRAGKVITAENGRQGLELFEAHTPDIVIADLYMPEMDGLEMLRRIREGGHEPAVIVVSAVEDVETILSAIDTGIVKYILKPVNMQELLEVLAERAAELYERRRKSMAALPENRKKVEDEIKKEFAAMLKTMTGKGPRDVSVFCAEDRIELMATEVLTIFEKNLLDNYQNIAIIKYIRELFFSVKALDLCSMLSRISGRKVSYKEVQVNVEKDRNKLIFTIEEDG